MRATGKSNSSCKAGTVKESGSGSGSGTGSGSARPGSTAAGQAPLWPARATKAAWQDGQLTLDDTKVLPMAADDHEAFERLCAFRLLGLQITGLPLDASALKAVSSIKSLVNLSLDNCSLDDSCFEQLGHMQALRYLSLENNGSLTGRGVEQLDALPLELLSLSYTSLDDLGLKAAAGLQRLSMLHLSHTAVTFDGLMATADNSRLKIVAGEQFSDSQMDEFERIQLRRSIDPLDSSHPDVVSCREVLWDFFAAVNDWEKKMESEDLDDNTAMAALLAIWDNFVCESPAAATAQRLCHGRHMGPIQTISILMPARKAATKFTSTPVNSIMALNAASCLKEHLTAGKLNVQTCCSTAGSAMACNDNSSHTGRLWHCCPSMAQHGD